MRVLKHYNNEQTLIAARLNELDRFYKSNESRETLAKNQAREGMRSKKEYFDFGLRYWAKASVVYYGIESVQCSIARFELFHCDGVLRWYVFL